MWIRTQSLLVNLDLAEVLTISTRDVLKESDYPYAIEFSLPAREELLLLVKGSLDYCKKQLEEITYHLNTGSLLINIPPYEPKSEPVQDA